MLILPSDGTTFQINYREAYGKAIGKVLEKDRTLTLVAQEAFDDYDLGDTLFVLDEDYGSDRVLRLENTNHIDGRVVFMAASVEEFNRLSQEWPDRLPRPFLWRVPIVGLSSVKIPEMAHVVAPATTQSAYSLTVATLEQNHETIILEHRDLYNVEGYVDLDATDQLTQAKIQRVGADVTLVASSWLLIEALQAAEILAEQGVNAEVVDLLSLRPLGLATVKASAEKTKQVLVLDHMASFDFLRNSPLAQIPGALFTSQEGGDEKIGTIRTVRRVEKILSKPAAALESVQFFGYGRTFCGPF